MKKKILSILLLTTLALSLCSVAAPTLAANPKVVVHLKGALNPDTQLTMVMSNMSWITWSVVYGDIGASELTGADMLIMIQADSSLEYSDAELSKIKSWFEEGGKAIWVAADSDFGNDAMRQASANSALEYLGSSLRFEASSTEDPVSNGGAPYRVLGVSDNVDPEFAHLVSGVERGLFHGPGIIIGYEGGAYVALETDAPDGVYIIMTTSEAGVVVDNSEPSPEVHEAGDEGSFPVMALEVDYDSGNIVIATGDAPFGQYMGLYKPEMLRADRYGADANPQQGGRLFENIIDYVTQYSGLLIDSVNDIEAKEGEISDLESDVSGLEGDVSTLEGQVSGLNSEVSGLEDDVSDLEGDVSGLNAQVTSLEGDVTGLEADLAAAQSSASSWQMYAIAALIIGAIVGYFVGPMLKK
jgi:outer membrane murein-binding lipoprotein Lpp